MIARIVVFCCARCDWWLFFAMRDTESAWRGSLAVVVAGVALGLLGLRLTALPVRSGEGRLLRPQSLRGRVGDGIVPGTPAVAFRHGFSTVAGSDWRDAHPCTVPMYGQSPLTLALFGLFVGYYVCYFAGLLIHHQRIVREQAGTGG